MYDTRTNKYLTIKDLEFIINSANALIDRTKGIPELDNPEHADLVQGYRDRIHEIRLDLDEMFSFGMASENNEWYKER